MKRVLIIYTGGTIGMTRTENGYAPRTGYFRAALDDRRSPADALAASREWMVEEPCNGFWHGRAGVEQYVAA